MLLLPTPSKMYSMFIHKEKLLKLHFLHVFASINVLLFIFICHIIIIVCFSQVLILTLLDIHSVAMGTLFHPH